MEDEVIHTTAVKNRNVQLQICKIADRHVLIMYSKRLEVISFAKLIKSSNKSNVFTNVFTYSPFLRLLLKQTPNNIHTKRVHPEFRHYRIKQRFDTDGERDIPNNRSVS